MEGADHCILSIIPVQMSGSGAGDGDMGAIEGETTATFGIVFLLYHKGGQICQRFCNGTSS